MILSGHRDLLFDRREKQREYQPPELAEDEVEEINRLISWLKMETLIYVDRYGPNATPGSSPGSIRSKGE